MPKDNKDGCKHPQEQKVLKIRLQSTLLIHLAHGKASLLKGYMQVFSEPLNVFPPDTLAKRARDVALMAGEMTINSTAQSGNRLCRATGAR